MISKATIRAFLCQGCRLKSTWTVICSPSTVSRQKLSSDYAQTVEQGYIIFNDVWSIWRAAIQNICSYYQPVFLKRAVYSYLGLHLESLLAVSRHLVFLGFCRSWEMKSSRKYSQSEYFIMDTVFDEIRTHYVLFYSSRKGIVFFFQFTACAYCDVMFAAIFFMHPTPSLKTLSDH